MIDEAEGERIPQDGRAAVPRGEAGAHQVVVHGAAVAAVALGLVERQIGAAQQLWGMYDDAITVPEAKVVMASNGGAGALFCDTMLLGRERP